jgi:hypothetical protein
MLWHCKCACLFIVLLSHKTQQLAGPLAPECILCGFSISRGCFLYCPIREISVERGGTRVKRFFVSEAHRAELENLTEYRQICVKKYSRYSGAKPRQALCLPNAIKSINPYNPIPPFFTLQGWGGVSPNLLFYNDTLLYILYNFFTKPADS